MGILTISVTVSVAVNMLVYISLCTCDIITLGWVPKVRFVAANFSLKILYL